MRRRKKTIEQVEVIDIADKGHSIGKTPSGEILLIDGAVPGDNIDMVVLRKKKGLKFGKVLKINTYSEYRTEPFCGHFNQCGGCKWQNLNYEKQAELKENAVKAAIRRIADDDEGKVESILKGKKTRYYRNKLEYAFSNKRWLTEEEISSEEVIEARNAVGFHKAGAFDKVVEIEQCHLQEDLSNKVRNHLRDKALEKGYTFYDIRNNHGLLRNLTIRNTTTGQWMVTVVFGEKKDQIQEIMIDLSTTFTDITSWYYMINEKKNDSVHDQVAIHYKGEKGIIENLGHIKCYIGPKSFFQTNSTQAVNLYQIAIDYAELSADDILYDLYTGTGTIALYAAKFCKMVVGIEQIPEAIDDANHNSTINNITNCNFLVGDVRDTLSLEYKEKYGAPDVLITDPPRAGMHADVISTIL
ncbi:MAG: 23S rRNA (uracil(1939)-C(5))-methyltransferase RlmD, partial [Saprospiraceae bacterium]